MKKLSMFTAMMYCPLDTARATEGALTRYKLPGPDQHIDSPLHVVAYVI